HPAPVLLLSCQPPISAVPPSPDKATLTPCSAAPTAPLPTSFDPCCDHVDPERENTHAAPVLLLSCQPPISAVPPSPDKATLTPCSAAPTAPLPTSVGPCCDHVDPERENTHAAPVLLLSCQPPISAVPPSPDKATLTPCSAAPTAPLPTSFDPCCDHVDPERENTHAAPVLLLSCQPPISAVPPSPDKATLTPCSAAPTAPLPT